MSQSILEMTKDLIESQIRVGQLTPHDMRDALQKTYGSLMELKAQGETGAISTIATPEPIDWRKSITRHTITCLECGQSLKQLSVRHLREHGLDGRSYRAKYRVPRTQPLAARATTARRRQAAQKIKPWTKTPRYIQAQEDQMKAANKTGTKKGAARVKAEKAVV